MYIDNVERSRLEGTTAQRLYETFVRALTPIYYVYKGVGAARHESFDRLLVIEPRGVFIYFFFEIRLR